jgi:hypothetical protein
MNPTSRPILLGSCALAALLGSACGDEPLDGMAGERNLVDRLAIPTSFVLDPAGSAVTVVAGSREGGLEDIDLDLLDGVFVTRVNPRGEILVESLQIEVGDIDLPPAVVPPGGLPLRDIRLTIQRPGGGTFDDLGDMVAAVVELDVLIEWSAAFGPDGSVYPLRAIRLDNLPVALEIESAGAGQLRARLSAVHDGGFWSWAERFELRDLTVDLTLLAE